MIERVILHSDLEGEDEGLLDLADAPAVGSDVVVLSVGKPLGISSSCPYLVAPARQDRHTQTQTHTGTHTRTQKPTHTDTYTHMHTDRVQRVLNGQQVGAICVEPPSPALIEERPTIPHREPNVVEVELRSVEVKESCAHSVPDLKIDIWGEGRGQTSVGGIHGIF
jgi:hypothetical protein